MKWVVYICLALLPCSASAVPPSVLAQPPNISSIGVPLACSYPYDFLNHSPKNEDTKRVTTDFSGSGPETVIDPMPTPVPNPLQTQVNKRIYLVGGEIAADGATTVTVKSGGSIVVVAEFPNAGTLKMPFSSDVPACSPDYFSSVTVEQSGAATVSVDFSYIGAE